MDWQLWPYFSELEGLDCKTKKDVLECRVKALLGREGESGLLSEAQCATTNGSDTKCNDDLHTILFDFWTTNVSTKNNAVPDGSH